MKVYGHYYAGHEISKYGQENKRVDYGTLAKAFDAVLANDLLSNTDGVIGCCEQKSGFIDHSDEIDALEQEKEELESEKDELVEKLEYLSDEDEEARNAPDAQALEERIEDIDEQVAGLETEIEDLETSSDVEIYQWFVVSDVGADLLQEIDEIIYYNDVLDLYLWGVTFWGTGWDYVLTPIQIED